ncbi:Ig-like domain-containing protein [Pseudomonas sp. TNT2022 ID642]|uniref:Ig-like domain-containing protein n=1 Tax=Pseudomonas sp. TNT2022 ID642 TaxID=2942632 RepID=UPI00235F819F|nr:Ig-like domain-containing protein [Pseudomonas sp. TNT2022 ID642]MDD1004515.1 Ig-like domain-containing protein [Pseudomonas sp. TNT2022 ID642]
MSNPTPDALKSLYFPALNPLDPTEDYDGGIPIRGVENGLQGTVPAWLSMSIGDRVDVFWNNATQAVWSKTIQYESELNRDVIFTLAKDFVLDGDATNVYYKISGKNYPGEESRPRLKLLVKLTRPGEYDDIPGDDGHSDLNFSLDRYEVDQDFPQNGVVTMRIVPYRNLTRYDRIHARWGSQQVMHLVSPEQAADPLKNPIDITFDYNLIKAAGDGSAVAVAFQVVDRCGNYPDERAPWSALQSVLVDMNGDRLDSPLVLVKGQPTDRVDLDTLGDDDVIVRVYTTAKDFAVNDEVLLTWTGTPAQGPQIIVGPLSKTVDFVPFQLDFIIPNEAVRAIAKGSASVGFVRRREGESDRPSKNASVSVVGDISQLLAPTVDEAPGGTLPVDTPWATVSAPWYVGRNGSDLLNVIWEAKAPGGDPVYYEDPRPVGNVAEGEPVLRNVSKTEIQRFDGLSVKVYYVVTNRDNLLLSVRESLPFIMQVGVAKPTFDRPEVVEADDNDVLDPDNVPPTGATLVLTHTGTQDKDRFNFNWKGSASGGSFSDHIDLIPVTAGKPVRVTVPKQYVTANRDGTVTADYKIERGGETLGYSQELKLRIGVALDLKEPEIKEAPNNILQPIAAKDTLTAVVRAYPDMIGTQVSVTWTGTPGEGSKTEGPIEVTAQQDLEVALPNSLVAFNLGNDDVMVTYVVTRNGMPQGSKEMTLKVAPIVDGDPELGIPFITEAANNGAGPELNINALTADATMRLNNWPLIFPDQYVWSRLKGTNKDNTTYSKIFWQPPASKTDEEWIKQGFNAHAILLSDLRNLKNNSQLALEIKTAFGGSSDEKYATTFKERVYNVKTAAPLVWNDSPVTLTVHTASFEGARPDWDIIADTFSLPLYRGAKEGVPPYTYKSANESVATVDKLGNIKAVGKGKTIITLQDDAGETKTLEATVIQEHYTLLYSPHSGTQEEFVVWAGKVGGKLPPPYFLDTVLPRLYRPKNTSWHHVSYRRNTSTEEMMNPYLNIQFIPFPNIAPFLVVKE